MRRKGQLMRILVVMDSFKGSMTSLQAGQAVKDGILKVCPDADVIVRPMADGGEGTCEALSYGMDGNKITIEVEGPFGDRINASYFIVNGSDTAIIESASACGITLVSKHRLDPMTASSYGLGEMISDAIERGCRRIIIGLGGVATNDGGIGMLQGLGFSFRTADDREAARGAVALRHLRSI